MRQEKPVHQAPSNTIYTNTEQPIGERADPLQIGPQSNNPLDEVHRKPPDKFEMRSLARVFLVSSIVTLAATAISDSKASEPRWNQPAWSPVIIATGDYRQQLQATPIEYRPNRPLHVYGNVVRRRHHQGTYLPTPRRALPFPLYRGR